MSDIQIRPYQLSDQVQVVILWQICDLTRPWNNPEKDIERKLSVQSELFLVMEDNGKIIGTIMGGYDGHRGNIYYLAIHPDHQKSGYGKFLMEEMEKRFLAMGCPKSHVMIRTSNLAVQSYYEAQNYDAQDCILYGKRLIPDT